MNLFLNFLIITFAPVSLLKGLYTTYVGKMYVVCMQCGKWVTAVIHFNFVKHSTFSKK